MVDIDTVYIILYIIIYGELGLCFGIIVNCKYELNFDDV